MRLDSRTTNMTALGQPNFNVVFLLWVTSVDSEK
jgi:hypothetical protein